MPVEESRWSGSDVVFSHRTYSGEQRSMAHLVNNHPESVNITRFPQRTSSQYLRCHPVATASNSSGINYFCATGNVSLYTRETEVA
jgi:hypothetical protein